jgi:DNA-directed RNA polymerase subunit K/omega
MKIPVKKIINCDENIYLVTTASMKRANMIARYVDSPEETVKQIDAIAQGVTDVLDHNIKMKVEGISIGSD